VEAKSTFLGPFLPYGNYYIASFKAVTERVTMLSTLVDIIWQPFIVRFTTADTERVKLRKCASQKR
jgi:hypothetical protein